MCVYLRTLESPPPRLGLKGCRVISLVFPGMDQIFNTFVSDCLHSSYNLNPFKTTDSKSFYPCHKGFYSLIGSSTPCAIWCHLCNLKNMKETPMEDCYF